jgi:hypothetical protein
MGSSRLKGYFSFTFKVNRPINCLVNEARLKLENLSIGVLSDKLRFPNDFSYCIFPSTAYKRIPLNSFLCKRVSTTLFNEVNLSLSCAVKQLKDKRPIINRDKVERFFMAFLFKNNKY